ncbi:MAG: hypothetical protein J1D77_05660 [Muribaculaceae bacterium]|nr:hypothetical protein [Muribaculaceae bacterium]
MKKLFSLLALLGILLPAHAKDFYLAGGCNGWTPNNPSYKFTEDKGVYRLFLSNISGEFKIVTSAWEEQYGCQTPIEYGKNYDAILSDNAYNIKFPGNSAKDVTITFDYNNKTVRFDLTPELFLVGDFNGWMKLPKYRFNYADGVYTLSLAAFSGAFKVATKEKTYGNGKAVSSAEALIKENGENMTLAINSGRVKITVNPASLLSQDQEDSEQTPGNNPGTDQPEDGGSTETPPADTPPTDNPDNGGGSTETPPTDNPDNGGSSTDIPPTDKPDNGEGSTDTPPTDKPDNNGGGSTDTPPADKPDNGGGSTDNPPADNPDNGGGSDNTPPTDNPDNGDGGETNPPSTDLPDDDDNDPTDNPEGGNGDNGGSVDDPNAIEGIQADEIQPIYYNLNGLKIDNPSGGIFIRRQGAKVKKVYIP